MKFQFLDAVELILPEDCVIELPYYMQYLPADDVISAKKSETAHNLVIAAGTDPADQKITVLTAARSVLVFDAPKHKVPPGPSLPIEEGRKIFLPNTNGRWKQPIPGYFLESKWVISHSISALIGATLHTNYRDENNSSHVKKADTRRS